MSKKQEIQLILKQIERCKRCDLWKQRNKPVSGDGSLKTNIMFIGEAPGSKEDLLGLPFVGRAGKILDQLFESVDLCREDVYITNIIKCRPTKNRNPLKNEIKKCSDYLNKQIGIIQPKVIVTLGNFASAFIFQKYGLKYDKISKIHGKKFSVKTDVGIITVIPMFHPAIATYNPNSKKILIRDFKNLKMLGLF